jgi:putative redox protein
MITKTQSIQFLNHEGHYLAAKLELPPDRKPLAYAIFAHCFTCNKNWNAAVNISRSLASLGIAVLRFDFSGLGESEGAFVKSGFSTNITDILAAASFLEENFSKPSILIGHSLGGTAALYAAPSLPDIKGVVTIGSPADPAHVRHLIQDAIKDIRKNAEAEVKIGGRSFNIGKKFLEDLVQSDVAAILKHLRKALLIMHAPFDTIVSIDNAKWIYQHALHPKSFVSLDGADHILTNQQDSIYVGQVIGAWVSRYLPAQQPKTLESDLEVVASLQPDHHYTTLIKAGNHYLTADEPTSVGGDDFGPSPYQLLSAALGACSAMTLRMYAERKKWDLGEIQIHLKHDKVYIDDQHQMMNDTDSARKKIDVIERVLEFSGDLSEEQKNRLLEISNRCPVHRTLEDAVLIKTRIRDMEEMASQ